MTPEQKVFFSSADADYQPGEIEDVIYHEGKILAVFVLDQQRSLHKAIVVYDAYSRRQIFPASMG